MKQYNQRLENICTMLQNNDKDGFYIDLLEEYQDGLLTYSDAIKELKEIVTRLIVEYPENRTYKIALDYINY